MESSVVIGVIALRIFFQHQLPFAKFEVNQNCFDSFLTFEIKFSSAVCQYRKTWYKFLDGTMKTLNFFSAQRFFSALKSARDKNYGPNSSTRGPIFILEDQELHSEDSRRSILSNILLVFLCFSFS